MGTMLVVVPLIGVEYPAGVSLACDQHVVEGLTPDAAARIGRSSAVHPVRS